MTFNPTPRDQWEREVKEAEQIEQEAEQEENEAYEHQQKRRLSIVKIRPTWHFDGTFTIKVGGFHYSADYEFNTQMSRDEVSKLISELEVVLRESEESIHHAEPGVEYQVLDDWSDRIEEGDNHAV